MFRDPAAQLSVSLLTGQLASAHLRTQYRACTVQGKPRVPLAVGRQLTLEMLALYAPCLDPHESIDAREGPRLQTALRECWGCSGKAEREKQELNGAHEHLRRYVGTVSSRCPVDVRVSLALSVDVR